MYKNIYLNPKVVSLDNIIIKLFKDALQREPNNQSYKDSLDYNEERLNKWNEINNKYKITIKK